MAQVVLTGIRSAESEAQTHQQLAQLFKTTPDRVKTMLAAGAYVLKTNLDEATALKYRSALERAGATCRIEPDQPVELEVDLPSIGSSIPGSPAEKQTRIKSSTSETAIPSTSPPEAPKRTGSFKETAAAIVGVLILIQGGLWLFGKFGSSAADASGTKLEAALRLGESTKRDFETLKDEGGVSKNDAWHGLHVTAVRTQYADNDILEAFQLTVDGQASWWSSSKEWGRKGDTSPREVRDLLSKICNVNASDWKLEGGDGGMVTRAIEGGEMTCLYNRARPNSSDLIVMLSIKRVP